MSQSEFREVIELPATARVLFFDPPELVDRLIDEVIQTPGALPLLSFTLEQLYLKYLERQEQAQRDGVTLERSLTWADYDELGGVIGSLRRRADEIYATLPDDDYRATMQRVMLRMVAVDGGELARRRVTLSELKYSSQQENTRVQTVLDWLIDARLLVKGSTDLDGGGVADSVVEPAHDALVAAWDKLLQWKRQAEESLPLQRRLWQAASEWDAAPIERRSGLLWDTNPRLPQLEETLWPTHSKENGLAGRTRWVRQVLWPKTELPVDTAWLNRAEVAFVRASVKRRASGLRRIIASTAAVIVALSLALLFAEGQRRTAIAERDLARRQATLAEAGRISALGFSTLSDRDLDRALLLSVEAYRAVEAIEDLAPPMAARSMLLSALQHEPHQLAILRLPDIDPNDCTSVDEHLHIQQTFLRRYDADFAAAYTAASRAGFPDCAKETSFAPSSAEWDWSDEDEDNCFDSAGTLLAPYDQLATRFSDSDRSISDCFFSSERSLAALSVSTQPIGAGGMGQVELQLRLWRSLQWNVTSFYYVEQCAIETVDGIWQYEQQGRNLRIWKQDQLEIFPVYEVVLPAPSDAARHYGHYQVSSVTISPNQALIAATATSGRFEDFVQIFLWDAPSLQLVGEFFRDETWHASDFEESDQINVIKFLSDDELQLCYIERSPLFADATRRDLPLKTVTFAVTEQYWLNYACQVAGRNFTSEEWNSYFPGTPYRTTCEL
ncbi:MAG: hypothetical protein DCC55_38980 [Chloroflexi bacterium]|nr:MAG: hypothetical protein DCC55_38980 [Chloroflexota bacterium]